MPLRPGRMGNTVKSLHQEQQPPAGADARAESGGSLPWAMVVVLFALAYLAALLLGNALALRPSGVGTVWPAAGVYLAMLLLVPAPRWSVLVAAAAAVQFLAVVLILG